MKKKVCIELSSDLDYEGMVVNICHEHETIARVSYDKGITNMEIEFLPDDKTQHHALPLSEFLLLLGEAAQLAKECAEQDGK